MLKSAFSVDGTQVWKLSKGSEKLVLLVCDRCASENTTTFNNYNRAIKNREKPETFCKRCATELSGKVKKGKEIKKSGPRPDAWAEKHHGWRGGRFVASDGYVQVYQGPGNYRKEHFLVMEAHIGRRLTRIEVVHHIDLNKQNSALSNLALLPNESAHRTTHKSLDALSQGLVRSGLIDYDRDSNRYVYSDILRELVNAIKEGK